MMEALMPILEHVKSFYPYYVFGALIVLPVLFFTRRWSLPIIAYCIELAIYFSAMHIFMHFLVSIVRWFRENSSMRALREDGKPIDAPEWATPLVEFWDTTLYNPSFIFYIELGFIVLILILVYRLRPMKFQRQRKAKYNAAGQKIGKAGPAAQQYGPGSRGRGNSDLY
jgi:hypothetical protein